MEKVEIEADVMVAKEDIERHRAEIAKGCIKAWDSMEGELPAFESFCKKYMEEEWEVFAGKARWN